MTKEQSEYINQWLIKANEDIFVIEYLSKEEPGTFTSAICFHAQQAVEKFLKAFLLFNSCEIKKVHDVDFLLEECKKIDQNSFREVDLKNLTEYSVNARYPDDFIIPLVEDALYYKELAITIKTVIEKLLQQQP
jgi:HEPN domain-containing protein